MIPVERLGTTTPLTPIVSVKHADISIRHWHGPELKISIGIVNGNKAPESIFNRRTRNASRSWILNRGYSVEQFGHRAWGWVPTGTVED
jgi:hypothetical protein